MVFIFKKRHYFDSGSFTPIHPKASEVMRCILRVQTKCGMGNPLAVHAPGQNAKEYLEHARTLTARRYGIKTHNVVFTSGATEGNLLALRTAILHAERRGAALSDMHIIVGDEEHGSVYKDLSYFKTLGVSHTVATPQNGRRFMPADIVKHIRKNTVALTLQMVNSHHGVVQPIADIARACREKNPALFIHTDAAQGTAYYTCSPIALGADTVTIDGTKSFGPQGVGAILFQKSNLYTGLEGEHSLLDIRPGTPSVALIYGFATALNETKNQMKEMFERSENMRNYIAAELKKKLPDAFVHGIEKEIKDIKTSDWKKVAPHLLCVSFPNTNHQYLSTLLDTKGFSVSTGSACSSATENILRIGVLPATKRRAAQMLVRGIQQQIPIARSM